MEDAGDAGARRNRDDRERHCLCLLLRVAAVSVERHELLVLQVHILDVDLVERAERRAHAQERTGVFGMGMDAHHAVVAYYHGGCRHRHNTLPHRVRV